MRLYEILEARSNVPVDDAFAVLFAGKHKTSEISGVPPVSFTSKGGVLEDYLISGNTVQDGTPSHDMPVDVVGCGVRTGNLVEKRIDGCNINTSGVLRSNESWNMFVAKVEQGKTYCIDTTAFCGFYESEPIIGLTSYDGQRQNIGGTFISPITGYIAFRKESSGTTAMMNEGSQLLPYEPYGYKLPIAVNGTEYPIYLGQVPTTRRIRKLVFDGTEDWTYSTSGTKKRVYLLGFDRVGVSLALCSNFTNTGYSSYPDAGYFAINTFCTTQTMIFGISDMQVSDVSGWTQYLAQQYQNGTPVTVWYVLETPETAVVNEPLHKIGDYADTISMTQAGVTIPTVAGANTLTIDTAVQPSSVTIRGRIRPTL